MALSVFIAFLAGIISFLSPCVLPLIPGFLGYLAGTSLANAKNNQLRIFLNSVAYVLGFSAVFALLGVLLNTILVNSSYMVQAWLGRIGGLVIIFFGLHVTGLITIPWLYQEKQIEVKSKATYITSFLFGAAFAVGWSPCVGPVLGSVLALAASDPGMSFTLLLAYALGLGIPFLVVGAFSTQALAFIKKYHNALKYFNIIVGAFLIILGILVFTQTLNLVANNALLNQFLLK